MKRCTRRLRALQAERQKHRDRMDAWIRDTTRLGFQLIWDGQFLHFHYWGA